MEIVQECLSHMQLRIGDILHGAIICWNNLLRGFLEQKESLASIEKSLKEIRDTFFNILVAVDTLFVVLVGYVFVTSNSECPNTETDLLLSVLELCIVA